MRITGTNTVTELDYLYHFEAAAKASAAACATMAAQAYDPSLRTACARQCEISLDCQQRARELICKLGGTT